LNQSSIGFGVHLGGGTRSLEVTNAVISPLTSVTKTIHQDALDPRFSKSSKYQLTQHEVLTAFLYVVFFGFLFGTLIPSYELWVNVFGYQTSIWVAVPALACALVLQTMSLTLVVHVFQSIALFKSEAKSEPLSQIMYLVYHNVAYSLQSYSFISVVVGSPIYNCIIKMMGGKIEGRALIFCNQIYEHKLITFCDKTIVDSSHISGHYSTFNDIVIGPCKVSGVLGQGVFAANALIISEESKPWHAFVGTYEDSKKHCFPMINDTESGLSRSLLSACSEE